MRQLPWQHNNDTYTLETPFGQAIIEVVERDAETLYMPRIIAPDGQVISEFEFGLNDLLDADAFIWGQLVALDLKETGKAGYRNKQIETLNICLQYLAAPERVFHRRRVENIQRWLANPLLGSDREDLPHTDWANYDFAWQEDGNRFVASVPPHGQAIITDVLFVPKDAKFYFGMSSRFQVHIEDPVGIAFKDTIFETRDFLNAEAKVRSLLTSLESVVVIENDLDQLEFTLRVCDRLLPGETDLIHIVRLIDIMTYLGEVLP